MVRFIVFFMVIMLAGCATRPVSLSEAEPVPLQDIRYGYKTRLNPSQAELVITRDAGFLGSGCIVEVYIDGLSILKIDSAQVAKIYVSPGDHIIGARLPYGICPNETPELAVNVQSGERLILRISFDQGGLNIHRTAFVR